MNTIQLNIWSGGANGQQGLIFEPEIVISRLIKVFPELMISEVDSYTSRMNWAKSELKSGSSVHSETFLKNIITECSYNLPAVSFEIKLEGNGKVNGVVFKYGIRFFGNKNVNEGEIPESTIIRLNSFLESFKLKLNE